MRGRLMINIAQYKSEIDSLMSSWRKLYDSNSHFVTDGVVNPENWFKQDIRPMFLLKEAYSDPGDDPIWNLSTDYLRKCSHNQSLWRTVSQFTEGLFKTNKDKIFPYNEIDFSDEHQVEMFNKIAVVNIKKANGERASNLSEINTIATNQAELLYKEIKMCDPTIIVCGYTFTALANIVKQIENSNTDKVQNNFCSKNYERGKKGEWYYFMKLNGHDVLVFDYYHPSYRPPYLMKYYGLMGIYQMALNDVASNN